jgi:hypothetical protein
MWVAAWVIPFAILSVGVMTNSMYNTQQRVEQQQAEGANVGRNLAIYGNAVGSFARAYPSFTGPISDSSLGLPQWFRKHQGIGNIVALGQGYVFYTPPAGSRPALGSFLTPSEGPPSLLMGIARGGWLQPPGQATPTVQLPAGIPEGAIVFIR